MSRARAWALTGFRPSEGDAMLTKLRVAMGVAAPGFGAKAGAHSERATCLVGKSERQPFSGVKAGPAGDLTHFPGEMEAGPAAVAATSQGIANSRGDDESSTMPAA